MTLALRLARKLVPDRINASDAALIESAGDAVEDLDGYSLGREALARSARERGVDFATALFYAATCADPGNRELLEGIAGGGSSSTEFDSRDFKVLIVPAALYREFRSYRGDGVDIRGAAADLGIACETIPVGSVAGVRENARILARAVESSAHPGLILATLSKSGADARHAFESGMIAPGRVRGWLQIGGVLRGTPLADDVLNGNRFRRALTYGFLRSRGGGREIAAEMSYAASALLATELQTPEGVRAISFAGCPLQRHLKGSSLRRHGRLAPLGPNDAMTLLADAILPSQPVCPLWGCDHFFRAAGLQKLLRHSLAALCCACELDAQASANAMESMKAACL